MIKWKTAKRLSGSTKCFSIVDEGSTFPRRGHDGWAGHSRSELMKVGKTWALSPIPWQLLGVAGGRNKSVLVPRTSRELGRTDGGTRKRNVHVPPHPFAPSQRLHSIPPLVPHSGREWPNTVLVYLVLLAATICP